MYRVLFLLLIINSYPVYHNTILHCRPSVSVSVPFSRSLFSHRFHSAICWIPFSFLFRFCNETIPLSFRFRREGNNGGPMYAHVSEPDNSFLRSSAPRRAFGLILQAIRETFVTWLRDWVMEHSSGSSILTGILVFPASLPLIPPSLWPYAALRLLSGE